jgi:hypothetical protein
MRDPILVRKILVCGGGSGTEPFWRAWLSLAFSGGGKRKVVQHTPALRLLFQQSSPSSLEIAEYDRYKSFTGTRTVQFHMPSLLVGAVRPDEYHRLSVGGDAARDLAKIAQAKFDDIVLEPLDPGHWVTDERDIELPALRLRSGAIHVWVELDRGEQPDSLLYVTEAALGGSDRPHLFYSPKAGLPIYAEKKSQIYRMPATLTPEGVIFFAQVPDPRTALAGPASLTWAEVLLSTSGGSKSSVRLELLNTLNAAPTGTQFPASQRNPDPQDGFVALFQQALQSAERFGIAVSFRAGDRPFLSWPLDSKSDQKFARVFTHKADEWSARLDARLVGTQLLSRLSAFNISASLSIASACMTVKKGQPVILSLNSAPGADKPHTIRLTKSAAASAQPPEIWSLDWKKEHDCILPTRQLHARLKSLYTASGTIASQADTIRAFCPVEDGWLDVALPRPTLQPDPVQPASVLSETFVAPVDKGATLELGMAESASVELAVTDKVCVSATLTLQNAGGRARGLVFAADRSPADGDILPRLRPGATRDWSPRFGPATALPGDGIRAKISFADHPKIRFEKKDGPGLDVIHWACDPDLPWISSMNLAQAGGSRLPSESRSLVPWRVAGEFEIERVHPDGRLQLVPKDGRTLLETWFRPAADLDRNLLFQPAQTLPTLAGIERRWSDQTGQKLEYRLRYDLPILDALWASMMPGEVRLTQVGAEEEEKKTTGVGAASAVAPERLEKLWAETWTRHGVSEARDVVAFSGKSSGVNVDLSHLVTPRLIRAGTFTFGQVTSKSLPFGSYKLELIGDFETEEALKGITTELHDNSGLKIVGNAAAQWRADPDLRHDSRSIGWNEEGVPGSTQVKRTVVVKTAAGDTANDLVTLNKPIRIEPSLNFWYRDLPFSNGVFENGCFDDQAGRDIYDPINVPKSLYEWRVWSDDAGETESEIALAYGLKARPLQLKRVESDTAGPTRVDIACTVLAPGLDADDQESPGHTSPARNLAVLTYLRQADGSWTRELSRRSSDGKASAFEFAISPVLWSSAGSERAPFRLSLQLDASGATIGDARLAGKLFGGELSLAFESAQPGASAVRFKAADYGLLKLDGPLLSWTENGSSLKLGGSLILPSDKDGVPQHVALHFGEVPEIGWLGTRFGVPSLVIDHDTGAISFAEKNTACKAPLIAGLGEGSGKAAAVLQLSVRDTAVVGFVALDADYEPNKNLQMAFRHRWSSATEPELQMDFEFSGTSSASWPLAVEPLEADTPDAEIRQPFELEIGSGPKLEHIVAIKAKGVSVDRSSLQDQGKGFTLARPLRMLAHVTHRLHGDARVLAWTTLDHIGLFDLASLGTAKEDFAFAARYGDDDYRGITGRVGVEAPGIVRRPLAAAGFPDQLVANAIKSSIVKPFGLALAGASQSIFALPGGDRTVQLGLPWLAAFPNAELGPLKSLDQSGGGRRWQVAWYDGRIADLGPLPAADTALDLGDARSVHMPVEQPFFDLADWNPKKPPDLAITPLFLRSILAVSKLWKAWTHGTDGDIDLQQHLVQLLPLDRAGSTLRRPTTPPARAVKGERLTRRVVMAVVSKAGAGIVSLESALGPEEDLNDNDPRWSLLARDMDQQAAAGIIIEFEAGGVAQDHGASLPRSAAIINALQIRAGLMQPKLPDTPLPLRSEAMFASPALGWGCEPKLGLLFEQAALVLGDNIAFQDVDAAIAGRVAAFASGAGGCRTGMPFVASESHVLFKAFSAPLADASWPRHLQYVRGRARAPAADGPAIIPPGISKAVIGMRPGVMFADAVAMVGSGAPFVADSGLIPNPELGNVASRGPVLLQSHRSPRSTILPDVKSLDWRRRTFSVRAEDPPWLLYKGAVAAVRHYADDQEKQGIPEPRDLTVFSLPDGNGALPRRDWSGSVDLHVAGPIHLPRPSGSSLTESDLTTFRLCIGAHRFAMQPSGTLPVLRLGIEPQFAVEIEHLLAAATGDTRIAIEIRVGPQAAAGVQPPPKALLSLPLFVEDEAAPALAVQAATLLFGDPAFDRMLGSGTASQRARKADALANPDIEKEYLLALDRPAYDLLTPIIIGFGTISDSKPGKFDVVEGAKITLERQPAKGKPIPYEVGPISISTFMLDTAALPFGDTRLEAGDKLRVSVKAGDVELSVTVDITSDPVIPPAPAVYHLVTAGSPLTTAKPRTVLSATGPAPQQIELPSLEADLIKGFVRRRGLFAWTFDVPASQSPGTLASLIKMDRSGAGQIPVERSDFHAIQVAAVSAAAIEPSSAPETQTVAQQ